MRTVHVYKRPTYIYMQRILLYWCVCVVYVQCTFGNIYFYIYSGGQEN